MADTQSCSSKSTYTCRHIVDIVDDMLGMWHVEPINTERVHIKLIINYDFLTI